MPVECPRPLCSATVFSCIAAASILNTYVKLVPRKYSYTFSDTLSIDVDREASLTLEPYSYLSTSTRFRNFVIGAPSGGASQLATALKAPLIPCNILLPIERRRPSHPDDVDSYLEEAKEVTQALERILGNIADVLIHYDPIHDRDWVREHLTIRIHFRKLPRKFEEFVLRRASRDARIVFVNVEHRWLQFRVSERVFVQIGGANGLSDEDYVSYSSSVEPYLSSLGVSRYPWITRDLEDAEKLKLPESEWGCREELVKYVREFAESNGFEFVELKLKSFYETMLLGTLAYLASGRSFRGIVVENYKQSTCGAWLRLSYLPIWCVFTTRGSLERLARILELIHGGEDFEEAIYVSVPIGYREQGASWPDATSFSEWVDTLSAFAKRVKCIPKEVAPKQSTRTLDAMNAIYEEAWGIGGGVEGVAMDLDSRDLAEIPRMAKEILGG